MNRKCLKSKPDIHAFGVGYVCNFLDRAGFTILERNTKPDHHFQLFVTTGAKTFLIAVRTAVYPDVGTIDKTTKKLLIKEAIQRNAIPHFAGLAVESLETNDIEFDNSNDRREYKVNFPGITVVRDAESAAVNC